ncbi:MAG TPA: CCA tRNA nucleotidyltransferase [Melioribacteraceae bacterium]|nr:CCA tRNA nucleotidyltransferase [Melioribacteraceae bacterium]
MKIDIVIKNELFINIKEVAEAENTEVYLIGGYVRDIILERPLKNDIDIMVVGDGVAFASKVAEKLGIEHINLFKNFGTAHFIYKGMNLEFVGARKESYDFLSRKPQVKVGTFIDDIMRRDFTINTLAVSLNQKTIGELIDTLDGIKDIEERIIRTPLNPEETFSDDPLRILRAFRFATQLNFDVDEKILEAAEKMAERLKIVSQERITDEFLKIINSQTPSIGLIYLYKTGVMKEIFPEVHNLGGVEQRQDYHHKDVFYHTCKVIDNISKVTDNTWLRIAALLHDIAKPATKRFYEGIGWTFHGHEELGARMVKGIFKKMRFPFIQIDYVTKLIRLHLRPMALVDETVTDSAIRRLIVQAGESLDDLITLCRADITSHNPNKVDKFLENYEIVVKKIKEVEEKDKLRLFKCPVDGKIIMDVCKLKPSEKVGKIKEAIEDAILEGKIPNDYDAAYNYLLEIKDLYINL